MLYHRYPSIKTLYRRRCASASAFKRHISYQVEGRGYFLSFYVLSVKELGDKEQRVSIYFDRENLICITENAQLRSLMTSCAKTDNYFHTLFEFFMQLTAEDIDILEHFEDRITMLEDELLTGSGSSRKSSRKIIAIRRELLRLKPYYEQLGLVISVPADNEKGFFHEGNKGSLPPFLTGSTVLLESVLHLREYITQVRELIRHKLTLNRTILCAYLLSSQQFFYHCH